MQNKDIVIGFILGSNIGIYYSGYNDNKKLLFIFAILSQVFLLLSLLESKIIFRYRPRMDVITGIFLALFVPIFLNSL